MKNVICSLKDFFTNRYWFQKAVTLKDYADRAGVPILFRQNTRLITSPVRYIERNEDAEQLELYDDLLVCQLQDASIVGSSNVVVSKSREILYDQLVESYTNNNYKITDWGLKKRKKKPIRLGHHYIVRCRDYGMTMDSAISLIINFAGNYYHFIMEAISKFYLLAQCNIPDDVPVLIDYRVSEIPQQMELLRMFLGNRKIIYLKPRHLCHVKRLYCLSNVNRIIPNYVDIKKIKTEDNWFCPNAIDYVRQRFLAFAKKRETSPKRFFIARKHTTSRSYNERELTQIALEYGFEILSPEEYTVTEQFGFFSSVECVIAASGAALSNIICCRPGCKVLVLFSQKIDLSIFSGLAACLNIDMRYLTGKSADPSILHSSYTIDKDDFRQSITNWLISSAI